MGSKQERLFLSCAPARTADRCPDAVGCCDVFRAREGDKRGSASKSTEEVYNVEVILEARIAWDKHLGCDVDRNRVFLTSPCACIRASAVGDRTREKECDRGDQ